MTTQIDQLLHHELHSPEVEAIDADVVRPFPQPRSPDLEGDLAHGEPPTLWEYRTALGGSSSVDAEARLNALGGEGWELVTVVPPQDSSGQTVLYMKREKQA